VLIAPVTILIIEILGVSAIPYLIAEHGERKGICECVSHLNY
jgi:hypothetical protein